MPSLDAVIIREPIRKKQLVIVFDENDSIYDGIKCAMIGNKVNKVLVEECKGKMKDLTINYFSGNSYRKADFVEKEIRSVSGQFILASNNLNGTLKICTNEKNPVMGTLSKARAIQDFTLKLYFY